MAERFVRDTGARNDNNNNDAPLSARESEIVQLLARGKSNKEAAAMTGVCTRTVESHLQPHHGKNGFPQLQRPDPLRHPQQFDPSVATINEVASAGSYRGIRVPVDAGAGGGASGTGGAGLSNSRSFCH